MITPYSSLDGARTWRQVALAGDDLDPEAEARRDMAPIPEETFMH